MSSSISGSGSNAYASGNNYPAATGPNNAPQGAAGGAAGGKAGGASGLEKAGCEALHGLSQELGDLGRELDRLYPGAGAVLRGAEKALDDLKFCPYPSDHPKGFDPGHRTSPGLNSDEKMLLKQMEKEMMKKNQEVIRNIRG